jgi:protein phosphatase
MAMCSCSAATDSATKSRTQIAEAPASRSGRPPSAAQALALGNGGRDNVSVVVIRAEDIGGGSDMTLLNPEV